MLTASETVPDRGPGRSPGALLGTAIHSMAAYARAFKSAAEPPPRPGLPDADLLASMVPESRAALRELEWRNRASLIPRWYKLLLLSVALFGAVWGTTGSPLQALVLAGLGSCLVWVASECYGRIRQLKLSQLGSQAPG